jgi:HD-GYP domain-containing protein (c-di-GMP phosphodiesterase class II)
VFNVSASPRKREVGYCRDVPDEASLGSERVRAAEVIAALCLATDLGMGLPFEHGLESTLFAMRIADRLDVDAETASLTYYACLLFYVGCTADAETSAEIFTDETALITYFTPVMFGSRIEVVGGIMRALAPPGNAPPARAAQIARRLPRAVKTHRQHLVALCEVAEMLTVRLGLPSSLQGLWVHLTERWDGKGEPGRLKRDEIPLPLRIAHVARDAAFQRMIGGTDLAAEVIRKRAGGAFDPQIAGLVADEAAELLALDAEVSAWEHTLASEPLPRLTLEGAAIDRALAAMGDFADLASPFLVGHSAGVAELATAAARRCRLADGDVTSTRRAALVHDVGRVAIPVRIWQKPAPLSPDEWERVRLHAYHSERVLTRSPFLAELASVATMHHERCDGSGYHRGAGAAVLTPPARLLAAADAYHAMTEPRPHRAPLAPGEAAEALMAEARAGRLDAEAVAAVLEAAGQHGARVERPAGLTEREAEVIGLLARGLQTKQIARALGISVKTADRHIQNAYAKIGVSTRAAAALFAMEHGLIAWGELPMARTAARS